MSEKTDDRTLLGKAAKACANPDIHFNIAGPYRVIGWNDDLECDVLVNWNPLTDDGDALRLAVKLKLEIKFVEHDYVAIVISDEYGNERPLVEELAEHGDLLAATRRAITRAAASLSEQMP